ncbi:hypothetical protein LguiA_022331 [Lonicera macranthoides]
MLFPSPSSITGHRHFLSSPAIVFVYHHWKTHYPQTLKHSLVAGFLHLVRQATVDGLSSIDFSPNTGNPLEIFSIAVYALQDNIRMANINIAKSVVNAVRTILGPKGVDNMISSAFGGVIITNDGITILKENGGPLIGPQNASLLSSLSHRTSSPETAPPPLSSSTMPYSSNAKPYSTPRWIVGFWALGLVDCGSDDGVSWVLLAVVLGNRWFWCNGLDLDRFVLNGE